MASRSEEKEYEVFVRGELKSRKARGSLHELLFAIEEYRGLKKLEEEQYGQTVEEAT